MANLGSLLALLGAQATNTVGTEDISVNGKKVPQPEYIPPTYRADMSQDIPQYQDVRQASPDSSVMPRTEASPQERARQAPMSGLLPHKGMFGMKGTLRDVIGYLGDALGDTDMYSKTRSEEKLSDASVGYGIDPESTQAAIARVMAVNPKVGYQLMQQQQEVEARKAVTLATTQAKLAGQKIQKSKMLPGLLASAKNNPEQQAALKRWYEDPMSSVEDLDPDTLANAAMTEYQKGTLSQGDRRIDESGRHNLATESIGQTNAAANMKRANRPSAGRQPRAQTPLEFFQKIDSIPEGERTPGQRAFYKKYTSSGSGKTSALEAARSRMGGGSDAKPSGGKYVIRGGKLVKQ